MLTASVALRIMAHTTFRPFDKADWDAFAGCNSENPLIGEYNAWLIIIDGDEVQFTDCEMSESYQFHMSEPLQIF